MATGHLTLLNINAFLLASERITPWHRTWVPAPPHCRRRRRCPSPSPRCGSSSQPRDSAQPIPNRSSPVCPACGRWPSTPKSTSASAGAWHLAARAARPARLAGATGVALRIGQLGTTGEGYPYSPRPAAHSGLVSGTSPPPPPRSRRRQTSKAPTQATIFALRARREESE